MPGPLLTANAQAACAHQGQVKFIPYPTVKVMGQPTVLATPTPIPIAGCTSLPPPAGSAPPDLTVIGMPSCETERVKSFGIPLMIMGMPPILGNGIASGTPVTIMNAGQEKVIAM